jgi:integrase
MFAFAECNDPAELTEGDIVRFVTSAQLANNTVYSRVSQARTFLKWCLRNNYVTVNVADGLTDRFSPLATYKRTYGGVQARYPKRWLDHEEAYKTLISSCQDGHDVGLRDEIILRLGLTGMRVAEIASLTIGNVQQLPIITWTGKGKKPRKTNASPGLVSALTDYLKRYASHVDELTPTMPLLCSQVTRAVSETGERRIRWNYPISTRSLFRIVTTRAANAGLGHVAPHDLRRTAAGILHRATDEHGAHHFDLLDIQKVLGHSDPATTMRSYLDPMDTDVLHRASLFLD